MLIGYARVSTTDQNLDLQLDALQKAGCELIFKDTISGAKADRPGLKDTLSHLPRNDTLVVWKLDRLGRTTKGLIDLVEQLKERGIGFKSLQDNIDTSTTMGQFFFVVFTFETPPPAEPVHAKKAGKSQGKPLVWLGLSSSPGSAFPGEGQQSKHSESTGGGGTYVAGQRE